MSFEIPAMEAPNQEEISAGKAAFEEKLQGVVSLEIIKPLKSTKIL